MGSKAGSEMMKRFEIDVDEIDTDQKIKLFLIQEIANGAIVPIINRICIFYILTLIVWAFK